MAKNRSAEVTTRTINLTGPTNVQPQGVPTGIIGTSKKGKAFVPTTLATTNDFVVNFGNPTDDRNNGPLAVSEWLRNAQSVTFLRVLGAGKGKQRETSSPNAGRVDGAGFIVGARQPQKPGGGLGDNPEAHVGGHEGRLYFLNVFMSESNNSGIFSNAGLPSSGIPIVRGVLMAASGVHLALSSSKTPDNQPPNGSAFAGNDGGSITGSVNLSSGKQEFVMLLNGHKSDDVSFPNVITASFDVGAKNYFANQFNKNPYKLEDAGHLLYADYTIHPNLATPTGSNVVIETSGSSYQNGFEQIATLITGSATRNSGSTTQPSYENFEDRFQTPKSPWVISQKFGGSHINLFRIHSLDDGVWANQNIKVSIENLRPSTSDVSPYGTFDLLVRNQDDLDKKQEVLEAWRELSLNPQSDRYIARIVGDTNEFFNFESAIGSQKLEIEGLYPNQSNHIRVEVSSKVDDGDVDPSALPVGFRGPPHLVTSGSDPLPDFSDSSYYQTSNILDNTVQIPVPFRENLVRGSSPNQTTDRGLYWGVQFTRKNDAAEPNKSTKFESSIDGLTTYFPNFQTNFLNVVVSDNEGTADTTENGILDADRFNNNLFTLENIEVPTTSDDLVDTTQIVSWSYVRAGGVSTTGNGNPRALKVSDMTDPTVSQLSKFTFYLQGGFDGTRIFDRDTDHLKNRAIVEEMNNSNRGTSNGSTVVGYDKSLTVMSDETEVDVKLLSTPGIRHPIITDRGLNVTKDRFDALYIMDIEEYDVNNKLVSGSDQTVSVQNTATQHGNRGINNSFGAAYFPNVIVRDSLTNTRRIVPPSVAVLGAFSLNDAVGFPWNAPAGFARGALDTVEEPELRLSRENMDSLQSKDINPIVSFPDSDGVVVWGQNTLLQSDSNLERVNVRRLLIDIRRKVGNVARRIVFEQNREETLARFSSLVNPILKRVQDNNGLKRFRVQIDTSTTTQADIENQTIRGKIFLVPTKSLELLSVDFVVSNQGAEVG